MFWPITYNLWATGQYLTIECKDAFFLQAVFYKHASDMSVKWDGNYALTLCHRHCRSMRVWALLLGYRPWLLKGNAEEWREMGREIFFF